MNPNLLIAGTAVKVLASNHADVTPGDTGEIEDVMADGYGVKFTKKFTVSGTTPKVQDETRTLFFPHNAVERINPTT